jgi:RimJ/RimL family protein N-acetyltransferase
LCGDNLREEFSDSKITIKKIIPEHIPSLFSAIYESRMELAEWMPWCHPDYSIEETKGWVRLQQDGWKDRLEYSFGIFDNSNNKLVGGCGLNQINWIHNIGNLGYWIGTKFTGRGFASAATRLCAEFGFSELKLNRIEIVAAKDNIPSQKVAEKAGAKKECLARKRLAVGKKIHDAFVYSLIKEDIIKD